MKEVAYIVTGFLLLFFGGETLLKGATSLARTFRISKLLIGAVIIGFGTSMPELTVSVGAALKNSPGIALGNVIGSNIANILLIIGISGFIHPIFIHDQSIRRDIFAMLLSSFLLVVLMWLDALNFFAGITFLVTLGAYIYWSFAESRKPGDKLYLHMEEELDPQKPYKPTKAFLFSIIGIIALAGGASLLVDGAISLARSYGISETIIGLSLVAVGSSLPELATAVVASLKRHSDVVVGNIIGSCIFNILAILGVAFLIHPMPVLQHLMLTDVWVMLFASILLSFLILRRIKISVTISTAMLVMYMGYLFFLYKNF